MSQVWIYLGWYVLGCVICLASGLGRRPALACACSMIVGLSCWAVVTLLALGTGLPYGRVGALTYLLLPLSAAALVLVLRRPRVHWPGIAIGSILALGLALLASWKNLSQFTFDSHQFVALGRGVGYRGQLDDQMWGMLGEWGSLQIAAHSTASFVPASYLYSLAMVVWLALVATFAVGLHTALTLDGKRPVWVGAQVAMVTAALVTSFEFLHASVYIHANLPTAALLFCLVLLFWLADRANEPLLLVPACVCAVGLVMVRIETPFVAALFVLLLGTASRLPARAITCFMIGFAVPSTAWLALLALNVPADSEFLTPAKAALWIGVILLVAAYSIASARMRWLQRLNEYLPTIGLVLMAIALVATFALEPAHMGKSTHNLWKNLTAAWWGATWIGLPLLFVALAPLPSPPFAAPWRHGSVLLIGTVVLLGFVRIPYRHAFGDSANRMMLHVFPLLVFYLGLKLLPHVAAARDGRSKSAEACADASQLPR